MFRLLVLGLLPCLTALTGCITPRCEYVRTVSQTVETSPLHAIDLTTFNGAITVGPHDAAEVEMEISYKGYGRTDEEAQANAEKLDCEYTAEDGVLRVKAVKPTDQRFASVGFKLFIPKGCQVKLHTSNGRVTVSGLDASVAVYTSNGTVSIQDVHDSVVAKTSNGRINLAHCMGPIDLKTSNGRIEYSGLLVGTENQIRTSNGRVRVQLDPVQCVDISAKTSNGSISCELPTQKILDEGKRSLHAIVGTVDPNSQPAELLISTSNGSVTIEPASEQEATHSQDSAAEVSDQQTITL